MQYLISVLNDSDDLATDQEMADIDIFNEKLQAQGHWVFAAGLSRDATVLDNRGGKGFSSDGPFVESKEFIAGLWVIEAADLKSALALAAEGSEACNRRVEVRPMLGAPD